mgnify:CR=1 FL=1
MTPLPTRNSKLPLHRAAFHTVPEMLDYAAEGETGVTFYNAKGEIISSLPWRNVRERAHRVARKLIGAGFEAGERLLITADTWPGFFDAFFGAQYAGLIPVPVSIPVGIGGKEAYLDQLRRQFAQPGSIGQAGVRQGVCIADARKVIVTRIGVAALAISEVVADRVVVVALDALHVVLSQERKDAIGMRTEGAQIAQAIDRIDLAAL